MNLYVLRHGQTDYNIEGKFQGQVDIKMNKEGEKQTDIIAQELRNIKFDIIFASPLKRALETAKKIDKVEINIDKRIIERSFGTLEGKSGVPDFEENIEKYNIERTEHLLSRVHEFLNEILQKHKSKENILIVTHEAVAQAINLYFSKDISKLKEFRLQTGRYVKYEI